MDTRHAGGLRPDRSADALALTALAFLLPLPFYFVTVGGRFIFAPFLAFKDPLTIRAIPQGLGLPIAILAILPLVALFALRLVQRRIGGPLGLPATVLIAMTVWMSATAAYGLTVRHQPMSSALLFAQTVLPGAVFLASWKLPVSPETLRRCLLQIPLVGGVSIMVMFAIHLFYRFGHGLPTRQILEVTPKIFYSAKSVQPIVVLVGLTLLLGQLAARRRGISSPTLWLLLIVHASYLLLLWSRSALLMFGIVVSLWLADQIIRAISRRDRSRRFWLQRLGLVALMLLFATASLTVGPIPSRSSRIHASRARESAAAKAAASAETTSVEVDVGEAGERGLEAPAANDPPSDRTRRARLLRGAIDLVRRSPVIGEAFNPLPPGSIVVGRRVKRHRLYPAHNQYLDLAIRSGLPALALFSAFLIAAGSGLWRNSRDPAGDLGAETGRAVTYLLLAVAVGSMFHLFFVVTQSAVLLYFAIAATLRLSQARIRSRPASAA